MLNIDTLKGKLFNYLTLNPHLTRKKLKELSVEWSVEPDSATRRMRELCEEFPNILLLNDELKPQKDSEHIAAWKLIEDVKINTVFKK